MLQIEDALYLPILVGLVALIAGFCWAAGVTAWAKVCRKFGW